jgi:hypothetical protein
LPRQARDNHRENSKIDAVFRIVAASFIAIYVWSTEVRDKLPFFSSALGL